MIIYSKESRVQKSCTMPLQKKKYIRKETPQWAAVIPGKIFERKKQPYKASIDLWLAVLRGPMQSIIDLATIIELQREINKTSTHKGTAQPYQLNMRKSLL